MNKINIRWRRFHSKYLVKLKIKFINKFFNLYSDRYCWADCVSWAYNPFAFNPFKIDSPGGCKHESFHDNHKSCYCGVWQCGLCVNTLPENVKYHMELQRQKEYELHKDDLPF